MKKSLIFLSMFTALTAVSCGSPEVDFSKIALDYGHVYKNGVGSFEQIELYYGNLQSMMTNKESFVLLLYHDKGCTCWSDLFLAAKTFMNKYNVTLFPFDTANFIGKTQTYGIYEGTGGELPGIVFIRRGQVIRQTIYGNVKGSANEKIFKQTQAFENYMLENIYLPKIYYLEDKEILDAKINTGEEFNLYVSRKDCGDCSKVNTSYLYNWTVANQEKNYQERLYVFDIQPYWCTDADPGDPNYDQKHQKYLDYLQIKTDYKLSEAGSATFGFGTGSVPTFQRWKNGDVIDAITVLNDSLTGENKRTQKSYFTEAHIQASPVLRNTGNIYVYEGRAVPEEDVEEKEYENPETGQIFKYEVLSHAAQLRMHGPVLDLFLSAYVK